MASETREAVAGLRKYYQEEVESMIRLMKIEGGTLDDCTAELQLLADFVRSHAEGLREAWPDLLRDSRFMEAEPSLRIVELKREISLLRQDKLRLHWLISSQVTPELKGQAKKDLNSVLQNLTKAEIELSRLEKEQ